MFTANLIVTPIYAVIFTCGYLLLSFDIIKIRIDKKIPFANQNDSDLQTAIKTHENFAEYVPMFLILLLLLDLNYANPALMHILGITMVLTRSLYAYSVLYYEKKHYHHQLSLAAMISTFTVLLSAAIYNLMILFGWLA